MKAWSLGRCELDWLPYCHHSHSPCTQKCKCSIHRAIAQGSSEYNVTILVDAKESVRALRAVHARFYLATLPLALAIVGPGLIGSTFISQLEQQMEANTPPPIPPTHTPLTTTNHHHQPTPCPVSLEKSLGTRLLRHRSCAFI